jgi:hypothetical protein
MGTPVPIRRDRSPCAPLRDGVAGNGAHLRSQRRKETGVSEHDAVKSEDGSGRVEELTLAAGAWRSTGFGAPRRRQGNLAQTYLFRLA